MRASATPGKNRTGIATARPRASASINATLHNPPSAAGDSRGLASVRIAYAKEAEPPGTMPPAVVAKLPSRPMPRVRQGAGRLLLCDKLGERLAFERSGVRLYEALLSKIDAYGSWPGGPSREDLVRIREQELQHFRLLTRSLEDLDSDPTVVTPSANLHAVVTVGLPVVLADPRTDLRQGLEAIMVAELVDNHCWEDLMDIAGALEQAALVERFDVALEEEREHLRFVRRWLTAAVARDVTSRVPTSNPRPTPARARSNGSAGAVRAATRTSRPSPGARGAGRRKRGGRTRA